MDRSASSARRLGCERTWSPASPSTLRVVLEASSSTTPRRTRWIKASSNHFASKIGGGGGGGGGGMGEGEADVAVLVLVKVWC
eukprot:749496-Hanusia_phi.AAC.1